MAVLERRPAGRKANFDDPVKADNLSADQTAAEADKVATNLAAENPKPFQYPISRYSTTYKTKSGPRYHETHEHKDPDPGQGRQGQDGPQPTVRFEQLDIDIQERINNWTLYYPLLLIAESERAKNWLWEAKSKCGHALQSIRTATRVMGELKRLKAAREQTENPLTWQELDRFYSKIGMCQKAISESECFIDKFNLQQRDFRLQYSELAQKGQIDGQHSIGASGMFRILSPGDAGQDEEVSPSQREGQAGSNVRRPSPQETMPKSSEMENKSAILHAAARVLRLSRDYTDDNRIDGYSEDLGQRSSASRKCPQDRDSAQVPANIEPGPNVDRIVEAVSNLKSDEYPTDHQTPSQPPAQPFESSAEYRSAETTGESQSPRAGRGMDPANQGS